MKNALCLGTFDGVHLGHRAVLCLPDEYNKTAIIFRKPPRAIMSKKIELITEIEDKKAMLFDLGINQIEVIDFEVVKDISPLDFLEQLKGKYNPNLISCGFNYKFGKKGEGDIEFLKNFCAQNNMELRIASPVSREGQIISSTAIREYLKKGEVEKAAGLLGTHFFFKAPVIKGDARGRTLGFPTANQKYPEDLVRLKFGVYKTRIEYDGKKFFGITNIGIRPTFKTDHVLSETFIKGLNEDLYGKVLKITPLKFLRQERKFDSIHALKNQIKEDLGNI